ncbi:hypothetical protein BMS3Abin15_00307 [bacterium BMS3Abin15]|nr:hypothetical protein BMS3Abin15_00307 [bacterium BMS3Abin15]HDZ85107.1 PrsW family intramembrane metalloprotease [Candidatus Moranbacteria bacterium]
MRQIESLFLGIIAALGAVVLELIVLVIISIFADYETALTSESLFSLNAMPKTLSAFHYLLLTSAVIEESLKYVMIVKRVEVFSLDRKIILNSFLVGLGFALVEVVLIYGKISSGSAEFFYQNIAEIILIHVSTAGIIGYFIATRNPKKIRTFIKPVAIVVFFHLLYNLLVVYRDNYLADPLIISLLTILVVVNIFNIMVINRRLAS